MLPLPILITPIPTEWVLWGSGRRGLTFWFLGLVHGGKQGSKEVVVESVAMFCVSSLCISAAIPHSAVRVVPGEVRD